MGERAATTNLVLSGGPLHDFDASTASLVERFAADGITSTVLEDPHVAIAQLASRPSEWDLVTINTLRWSMPAERHRPLRDEWAFTLDAGEAETVERYVRDGGGLLACHTTVICFDAAASWHACLGASWDWDRSSHPPLGAAAVSVTEAGRTHTITRGTDDFSTVDEIYGFLDLEPDVTPLLTSRHGGVDHPVLWARELGQGRVVTDLLGHDAAAMAQPDHARILRRATAWLAGLPKPVADEEAP